MAPRGNTGSKKRHETAKEKAFRLRKNQVERIGKQPFGTLLLQFATVILATSSACVLVELSTIVNQHSE